MDSDSYSYSQKQLDDLFLRMISFYEGDPKRIQHFTKVHSFSRIIGIEEELDDTTLFILEAAAYAHDIGIRPAEEKYGKCDGKLQEQEGPIYAQQLLSELGFENYMIERICYLIGHHHTYTNVEGMDYQILIEADFLVNLAFSEEDTARICFLISRHHTYTDIDGIDLQILIEADFLVNLFEDDLNEREVQNIYERIFKTKTGKQLFCEMYGYAEET